MLRSNVQAIVPPSGNSLAVLRYASRNCAITLSAFASGSPPS